MSVAAVIPAIIAGGTSLWKILKENEAKKKGKKKTEERYTKSEQDLTTSKARYAKVTPEVYSQIDTAISKGKKDVTSRFGERTTSLLDEILGQGTAHDVSSGLIGETGGGKTMAGMSSKRLTPMFTRMGAGAQTSLSKQDMSLSNQIGIQRLGGAQEFLTAEKHGERVQSQADIDKAYQYDTSFIDNVLNMFSVYQGVTSLFNNGKKQNTPSGGD